jgi:Domain of unknown function (DUF5134)
VAGPSWLAGLLAAVMIATAVYCVSRLAAAWRWRRLATYDIDAGHVFMGVAMAGMLVPRLDPFREAGWEAIFGVAAAWFAGRAVREYLGTRAGRRPPSHHAHHGHHPHYLHHVLASGAMVYMLAYAAGPVGATAGAAVADRAMPGMAGAPQAAAGLLPLTLGLALALIAGMMWAVDRVLASPGPVTSLGPIASGAPVAAAAAAALGNLVRPAGPPISPRLAACCEIVMGVTMSYMLITML